MNASQQVTRGCDSSPAGVVNTGSSRAYRSERIIDDNAVETKRNQRQTKSAAARKPGRHGDVALRDRIVLENLSLVKAVAARVHGSLPVHIELDDLTHAGILGLVAAATRFDPAKHVVFATYAKHRIRGAILD